MQVCIKFIFWNSKYYLAPAVVLDLSVVLGSARRRSLPTATECSSEMRPLGFIWFIAWLLPSHILSMCPSKTTSLAQRPFLQSCSRAHILSSPHLGPSLLTSNWLFQPSSAAFIPGAITFHTGMERAVGWYLPLLHYFGKLAYQAESTLYMGSSTNAFESSNP